MRIQHNIPAMNAYRNYNTNVKSLQGNLQKLSSGYKINKAGDDAAGLAISEKMRAQITGLEVAQKNAKDGISLVQTAEGALTEVHTMLNRMYSLAEQSANGTYADEVDREQLQKEVVSLRDEINRIADASNFNGKKLLDGSLSGTGSSGSVTATLDKITGSMKAGIKDVAAVKAKTTIGVAKLNSTSTAWADGDKITFEVGTADGKTTRVELTAKVDNTTKKTTLVGADGTEYKTIAAASTTAAGNRADADVLDALASAFKDTELGKQYNITAGTNQLIFEAKNAGGDTVAITSESYDLTDKDDATQLKPHNAADGDTYISSQTEGEDAYQVLDVSQGQTYDGTSTTGDNSLKNATFEINGKKFAFVDKEDDKTLAALKEAGITHYVKVGTAGTIADTDAAAMAAKIQMATGVKAEAGTTTAGTGGAANTWATTAGTSIKLSAGTGAKGSGGLTLQIGDTSDDYNKMSVRVNDMHAKAMGIGDIDIGNQDGASAAMTAIKSAINYVSDTRGDLGALQNRLDHTISNLAVQQENIQDAEATIRDVDVANEMMAYTKNNILVQSAQAMLAQANQLPQGVLQLLG